MDYSGIIAEKYRIESIIDHAHALYGTKYTPDHHWAVIFETTKDARYKAHLIVYDEPGSFKAWTTLRSSGKNSVRLSALDNLMTVLGQDVSQRYFR